MLASQPSIPKSKLMKIFDRWPMTLIIFGVGLTLIWLVLLIWLPLRLLQVL